MYEILASYSIIVLAPVVTYRIGYLCEKGKTETKCSHKGAPWSRTGKEATCLPWTEALSSYIGQEKGNMDSNYSGTWEQGQAKLTP